MMWLPKASLSCMTSPHLTIVTVSTNSVWIDVKFSIKDFLMINTEGDWSPPIILLQLKNSASLAAPGSAGLVLSCALDADDEQSHSEIALYWWRRIVVATSSDKIPVSLDTPENRPISLEFVSEYLLSLFSRSTRSKNPSRFFLILSIWTPASIHDLKLCAGSKWLTNNTTFELDLSCDEVDVFKSPIGSLGALTIWFVNKCARRSDGLLQNMISSSDDAFTADFMRSRLSLLWRFFKWAEIQLTHRQEKLTCTKATVIPLRPKYTRSRRKLEELLC